MDERRIRSSSCIARWNLPRSRYRDEVEVGDLISRAVVQKMIQAAITKRLPVFAGGDEGAVFAALFSFLRAVCYDRGRDVVSYLYK